jgi:uridine kinase
LKGDKIFVHEGHINAARQIISMLFDQITESQNRFIITIAGESGSGKSEIATAFTDLLSGEGINSVIFQQDDYFVYPPGTNAGMRRKNIDHVGLSEVRLALLDRHLKDILDMEGEIEKPLVVFEEDQITRETVKLDGIKVVIVEGTYTTLLENVHQHVFIDMTYVDTKEARLRRAREEQDEFLETILEIEHGIISSHKSRADIIVTKDYRVRKNDKNRK